MGLINLAEITKYLKKEEVKVKLMQEMFIYQMLMENL